MSTKIYEDIANDSGIVGRLLVPVNLTKLGCSKRICKCLFTAKSSPNVER